MKELEKHKGILLMVLVAILIYFFAQPGFMASLVTICDNTEPVTMRDIQVFTNNSRGFFTSKNVFEIEEGNGSLSFAQFESVSSLGTFNIVDLQGTISCDDLLLRLHEESINTSIINLPVTGMMNMLTLQHRQVLSIDEMFYWCNYERTLLLSGSPQSFSNYLKEFETCTDVKKEYVKLDMQYADGTEGQIIPPATTNVSPVVDKNNYNKYVGILLVLVVALLLYVLFGKGKLLKKLRGKK